MERLHRDENLVNLRRLYCAKLMKIMLGGLHDNIQYLSCTQSAFPLGPTEITESCHRVGLPDSDCFVSSNPALGCTEPQGSLHTCNCCIFKMYRFTLHRYSCMSLWVSNKIYRLTKTLMVLEILVVSRGLFLIKLHNSEYIFRLLPYSKHTVSPLQKPTG